MPDPVEEALLQQLVQQLSGQRPPMMPSHVPTPSMLPSHVQVGAQNVGPNLPPDMIRDDGTAKGNGFLGEMPRPGGGVSSELSVPLWERGDPGQKDYAKSDQEMPLMVSTLSDEELQYLLNTPPKDFDWQSPIMQSIGRKASAGAKARLGAGKSPFAEASESPLTTKQGPELPLDEEPRMMASHAPQALQTDDPIASILQKAQSIGPSQVGERYTLPPNPTTTDLIKEFLGGSSGVPRSVLAQDPMGIDAWQKGAGPMPIIGGMAGTIDPAEKAAVQAIRAAFASGNPAEIQKAEQAVLQRMRDVYTRGDPAEMEKKILGAATELAPDWPHRDVAMGASPAPAPQGTLAGTIVPEEPGSNLPYEQNQQQKNRWEYFYKRGLALPNQADWEGQGQELIGAFGGDKDLAYKWGQMVGATSPGTDVGNNTKESVAALLYYLEHPDQPMTNSIAERLRPRKITMAESKVPNLNLAFSGQELGSPKANAFAGYMVGDPRVPMDVHGLFGGGSFQEKIDAEYSALRHLMTAREGLPFKKSLDEHGMYKRFEEAVVKAILPLDPTRGQNQIWGTLWEGIRDYKGLPYQGGPVDILRVKKLLGEGAMLDKDFLRWTLKQGGWTAGAIAGLMAAMPDSPAMVPSHAQPGAAGAADESAPQTLGEQ